MKATSIKNVNVRVGKPSLNAPCYKYLTPGTPINVDGFLYKGDLYNGLDDWLKDDAGNFYWSGGVDYDNDAMRPQLQQALAASMDNAGKISFPWFDALGIADIWNTYNERGNQLKIAVLDTGYSLNVTDVAGAIAKNGAGILIDATQYPEITLTIEDQSDDSHGTRCGSFLSSRNNSQWLIGIAPQSQLISGKISINEELRAFDYLMNGIDWAIKQGADIISISFAVPLNDSDIKTYGDRLSQLLTGNEVMIFAAAGNVSTAQTTGPQYPASFPACISIGATDETKNLSAITLPNDLTVLHAQGVKVESLDNTGSPSQDSGTSFSTPMVAAIAGLAVSYLKNKGKPVNRDSLLAQMIQTGDPIPGNPNKKLINPKNLFAQL